jgi:hypothetical protein
MKKLILLILFVVFLVGSNSLSATTPKNEQMESAKTSELDVTVQIPETFHGCANLHDAQVAANIIGGVVEGTVQFPKTCGLVGNATVWNALNKNYKFYSNNELGMGLIVFDISTSDIYMGSSDYNPVSMTSEGTFKVFVIASDPLFSYLIKLNSK